jgi:hypothetical protein
MEADDKPAHRGLSVLSILVLLLDVAALLVPGIMEIMGDGIVPRLNKFLWDWGYGSDLTHAGLMLVLVFAPPLLAGALVVKEFKVRPVARLITNLVALVVIFGAAALIAVVLMASLLSRMQAQGR